jgi:hypothetical protein
MSEQRKEYRKIPIYATINVRNGGSKKIYTDERLLPENWNVETKLACLTEDELKEKENVCTE